MALDKQHFDDYMSTVTVAEVVELLEAQFSDEARVQSIRIDGNSISIVTVNAEGNLNPPYHFPEDVKDD